jgi:hypothetical protein
MSIRTADNTLKGAQNLKTINPAKSVNGFVGKADRLDFYQFTLRRSSNLRVSLERLKADANLTFFNRSYSNFDNTAYTLTVSM